MLSTSNKEVYGTFRNYLEIYFMILENNFDMQIKKYVSWNVLKKSIGYKWKKQSIKSLIRYINSFARANSLFCAGFFHSGKILDFLSSQLNKSHLPFPIWCGKRDNHFSRRNGKGVRLMKPSDFQKTVQCRFESCLKKVVRSVVKDYYKELNRRKNKEISFSELPDVIVDKMTVWDDYETDYTIFSVCGIDIRVLDDELAEALKKLPERKRNTLLMYYFLEMTESEIANLQKITQSGVFRNRHHALETMKKILKEEH